MAAATIYKLLTRSEWEAAQEEGYFSGSAHDQRDGFIHFSTAAQLGETARKHFAGVSDLVLLAVDAAILKEGIAPHPVLLPMGEGTPEQAVAVETSSSLPEGEGQGEGFCPLRFEPSRGGELFPHLYAPLPVSAVKSASAVLLGSDGMPIIPCGLEP
jgi:uncharacterized protein (DUF952 family)